MIQYKKIAIEGNIGAGKSSLTKILAEKLSFKPIYENFENNKFLEGFYKKKMTELFALENSLLLSRINSLSVSRWNDSNRIVADFWLLKSLLFASINLQDSELVRLFETNFELLNRDIEKPDLVIYLKSDPNEILKRIKKRGRNMEKNIELNYLNKIHIQYQNLFTNNRSIPTLEIDTHTFNFIENETDFNILHTFLSEKSEKSYTVLLK